MTPPTPRPRRRRPWWLRLTVRLGVVLVVGVALYGYLRYRIEAPLREAMARLDREDPGWRLAEIEAAREVIPEEENSARVVTAAAALLSPAWWQDQTILDLVAVPSNLCLESPLYERVCKELDKGKPGLAEARRLADLPRGRFPVTYPGSAAVTAYWPHEQAASRVGHLLLLAAARNAEDGDPGGALADCRAAVNAARSLGDEPLRLSQDRRNLLVLFACMVAERALARGEPPPEALAALQRLLEEEDAFPALWAFRRAERADWHENDLAALRSPRPSVPVDLPHLLAALSGRLRNEEADLYARHALVLSLMTRYVGAARLPMHVQVAADAALDSEVSGLHIPDAEDTPLWHLFYNGQRWRGGRACVRCLIACLACERYRRSRGEWPAALADLVPAQLVAVPLGPFDGRPLRYRRLPDGVAVYSVGPDGKDDDDMFVERGAKSPNTYVSYRLWDPARRWQKPAEE